jgi:hypothetical protein
LIIATIVLVVQTLNTLLCLVLGALFFVQIHAFGLSETVDFSTY